MRDFKWIEGAVHMASNSDDKDRYVPVEIRFARDTLCDLIVAELPFHTNGEIMARYKTWRDQHRKWITSGRYSAFSFAMALAIGNALGIRTDIKFRIGGAPRVCSDVDYKPALGGRTSTEVYINKLTGHSDA